MRSNFFEDLRIGAISLFPDDREVELTIPAHSDAEAFQQDLMQVGNDMHNAMQTIDLTEHPKKTFPRQ